MGVRLQRDECGMHLEQARPDSPRHMAVLATSLAHWRGLSVATEGWPGIPQERVRTRRSNVSSGTVMMLHAEAWWLPIEGARLREGMERTSWFRV